MIVGQLFEALTVGSIIAGGSAIANALIVSVTVGVMSAGLWWWHWADVERHHQQNPLAESDSIWRKLYVIATFGLGGIVLGVSTVRVLFVLLRDILDSQLGDSTVQDLANPVGWAIAVAGGVFYHLGVWKVDHAVIVEARAAAESASPPPPPEPPPPEPPAPTQMGSPLVRKALGGDYGEIFTLHRAALADEAIRTGTLSIGGDAEPFDAMSARLADSTTVVATINHRIVGALTKPPSSDSHPSDQTLVVAPDQDHDQIAALLLERFEVTSRCGAIGPAA